MKGHQLFTFRTRKFPGIAAHEERLVFPDRTGQIEIHPRNVRSFETHIHHVQRDPVGGNAESRVFSSRVGHGLVKNDAYSVTGGICHRRHERGIDRCTDTFQPDPHSHALLPVGGDGRGIKSLYRLDSRRRGNLNGASRIRTQEITRQDRSLDQILTASIESMGKGGQFQGRVQRR